MNLLVSFRAWAELVWRYLLEVINTVNPSSILPLTLTLISLSLTLYSYIGPTILYSYIGPTTLYRPKSPRANGRATSPKPGEHDSTNAMADSTLVGLKPSAGIRCHGSGASYKYRRIIRVVLSHIPDWSGLCV